MERAIGIEPKDYMLSLADSMPLAPVSGSNPQYQYLLLDYSWTTNPSAPEHGEPARIDASTERAVPNHPRAPCSCWRWCAALRSLPRQTGAIPSGMRQRGA